MGLCVVEKEGCGLRKVKVYLKVVLRIIKVDSLRSINVLSQFASYLPTTIGNINYKVREFQKKNHVECVYKCSKMQNKFTKNLILSTC